MATATVDHYLPMFGRDFLTSTAGWTAAERGHYFVLLIVQWEQGAIPEGLDRLELVSPGVTAAWAILEPKFPIGDDGLRRNRRLEEHRAKAQELKEARSEAGKRGNDARWGRNGIANGSQTHRKAIANGIANGVAKTSPPSPSPSPEELHTHTPGEPAARKPKAGEPEPAGWAAEEWQRFVAVWNATERAEPWRHLTAPDGWADLAAAPGWLDRASQALAMLPSRAFFVRPLPLTRFFGYIDRIRAGEFADAFRPPPQPVAGKTPRRGNL
jgi:uncharacterized protein YdaU (DUF1376 family)